MANAKLGRIIPIITAIGAGMMAVITELSNNRREAQLEDLIERVDRYLPQITSEGEE